MNNPIINDPITMVAEAFEALHPGVKYEAAYAPDIRDDAGTIVCSCITFPSEEDGPDAVPVILINSQAGIEVAEFAAQFIPVKYKLTVKNAEVQQDGE